MYYCPYTTIFYEKVRKTTYFSGNFKHLFFSAYSVRILRTQNRILSAYKILRKSNLAYKITAFLRASYPMLDNLRKWAYTIIIQIKQRKCYQWQRIILKIGNSRKSQWK